MELWRVPPRVVYVFAAALALTACAMPAVAPPVAQQSLQAQSAVAPMHSGTSFRDAYRFKQPLFVANPFWGVVGDSNGNLYGTTSYAMGGAVFELTRKQHGARYSQTALHFFNGVPDGFIPDSGLVRDARGALYGVTLDGGSCTAFHGGCGAVYRLAPSGGGFSESVIWSFTDVPDGAFPIGTLVLAPNGTLYGVTQFGGANDLGTAFALTPNGSTYSETVLHSFGGAGDGIIPYAGLTMGAKGRLFGTTIGATTSTRGRTVYELVPSHGTYRERVLYTFGDEYPVQSVTVGDSGTLYGFQDATSGGGVFALTQSGKSYVKRTIFTFPGGTQGHSPSSSLLPAGKGNFYGELQYGGPGSSGLGNGVLYELKKSGGVYAESVLHAFAGSDGRFPQGGLFFDGKQLYGTATDGGNPCVSNCGHYCVYGCGVVFTYRVRH
ncbi:MAG TPA: choice-of-anchor tandem repeat GloVer-containing protein [Candidatus Cybelea sp.]|nr:choice-of-anchor tandem repeat GloVer-containing protein [Candidatus Cybelea sp.]